MSLNSITFPTTNIVSSKISTTDGTNTATLEPTNLTVDNVTITSINGSPYITPGSGYIDVDGNASGNIHMSNHSLDFVDGNYTASFSAGDLSVDNVNLTKINDVSFVPAVNYIDSSGLASGLIKMGASNINFDNGTGDYTDINISGITSFGLSTHRAQFYAVSQSGGEGEEPGVVINAGVFADTNSIQGGFYTDYNFPNGSYNDVHMGFENTSTPTIQATFTPSNLPPIPLAIDFKSPLNLVGVDASNVQLSSVAGHLSLNKEPSDVGDYTLQKYLPINLLGVVYYIPLFQATP